MSDTAVLEPRTKTKSNQSSVAPWGIAADHPRNCDLLLQSLPNTRLRSAIKPTKMIFDRENGVQITRPHSAGIIEGLPSSIPGMQLSVDPAKGTYNVIDPLSEDEDMCEKIQRALARQGVYRTENKIRGVPDRGGLLDPDHMKTLCREMCRLVNAGEAVVIKGSLPTEDDLENMAGEFLTNPVNMGDYRQPRYEKDLQAWVETLNRLR